MENQNIHVSGTIGDGAAVGNRARGGNVIKSDRTEQMDEVRRLLEQLVDQVRAHKDELDDPSAVDSSVDAIREELSAQEPRKGVVTVLLKGITASAGGVAAIADAASKVGALVGAIL